MKATPHTVVAACEGDVGLRDWATLTPETVRPAQFFRTPGAASQPEKRLMLAVLENAVWLLLRDAERPRLTADAWRQVAEAERWIASNAVDWPFSFMNICQVLGLDPAALRARLLPVPTRTPAPRPATSFPFRRVANARHRLR